MPNMNDDLHRCDNCGKAYPHAGLNDIKDYSMRVNPGGTVPSGECPDTDCGALCYPLEVVAMPPDDDGTLRGFLAKLKATEGAVTLHNQVATFSDGATFDLTAVHPHFGPAIERFTLLNDGKNPQGFTCEATRSGDYRHLTGEEIYAEVRASIFRGSSSKCVADVLVGITNNGEPVVHLTTDGDGDWMRASFYPMRENGKNVEFKD